MLTRVRAAPLRQLRRASTLAAAKATWGARLSLSEEVEHALSTNAPIIALESAIITHGMPYPANSTTASSLEEIIRGYGVTPATIALIDGKVQVGLSAAQLEELATASRSDSCKVSRRDLGPALNLRRYGGTTVAGTMILASSVGLQHFVTGGIGGVHRGAASSMDISADLVELGRTPMGVVCAGAKSILDIPRTLEYLETQGVCVTTMEERGHFPAFYSPSSGEVAPWHLKNVAEAAQVIQTNLSLPSPQATLVGVPIPAEFEARGLKVQEAVEQAVAESIEQGVDKRGKEVTPWLLQRVGELTQGTALELNIALIQNNAHVGARIVQEIWKSKDASSPAAYMPAVPHSSKADEYESLAQVPPPFEAPENAPSASAGRLPEPSVVVFGSAAVDITASTDALHPGSTSPGSVEMTAGGVGRNLAHAAQGLLSPGSVKLVSPVGDDALSLVLRAEMAGDSSGGLRTDGLLPRAGRTASCNLVLSGGDLVHGVADMGIVESLSAADIAAALPSRGLVVFDLNLSPDAVASLLKLCNERGLASFCDPTSVAKTPRLLPALLSHRLTHLAPNLAELDTLYAALQARIDDTDHADRAWEYVNDLGLQAEFRGALESRFRSQEWIAQHGVVSKMVQLSPFVRSLWVKAGPNGLLTLRVQDVKDRAGVWHEVTRGEHAGRFLNIRHYPAPVVEDVVNTTGAGDTLAGGLIAGLVNGEEGRWVEEAVERVARTLGTHRAVA